MWRGKSAHGVQEGQPNKAEEWAEKRRRKNGAVTFLSIESFSKAPSNVGSKPSWSNCRGEDLLTCNSIV